MQAINKLTISYFQSTEDYFWKWSEEGKIIEWSNGQTLIYWADLITILKELAPSGLPPFSAVLLGAAMCQDSWTKKNGKALLDKLLKEAAFINSSRAIKQERKQLKRFFSMTKEVASLEKPLRSGTYRSFLLKECFRNTTLKIKQPMASQIIDKFESGVLDEQIFTANKLEPFNRLQRDLKCFYPVGIVFYDTNKLTNFLHTSLNTTPEPLAIELPQEDKGEVLEALLEDDRTKGIAQLTKRLIAAIHIPMQTQGISDQSYGGISDITNRGNFDKLLLSELANDNDTLMARLVNNEALYFHHEEPPAPLNRDRVLLVDTTLRMWGLPRIFALSAALACAKNQKQEIQVTAFAIDSQVETSLDLKTKEGVLKAMSLLDGGLDCMDVLLSTLNKKQLVNKDEEVVLISNEDLLAHPKYLANLEDIQQQLSYIITVDRSGVLRFYHCVAGRRKLLSSPVFDLDILLKTPKGIKEKSRLGTPFQVTEVPAFLLEKGNPLLLPATNSKVAKNQILTLRKDTGLTVSEMDEVQEVLLINEHRRLLYWQSNIRGAIELLACIEEGNYMLEIDADSCWVVVNEIKPKRLTKVYIFTKNGLGIRKIELVNYNVSYGMFYKKEYYFLDRKGNQYYRLKKDFTTQKIIESDKISHIVSAYHNYYHKRSVFKNVKPFINNGYSVLQRVSYISIQKGGVLNIGKYRLGFGDEYSISDSLKLYRPDKNIPSYGYHTPIKQELIPNANCSIQKVVNYKRFVWENGSRAILDRRGLLHLKSYNKNLPEITIVLVLEKPVACWASWESRGIACGNNYFIPSLTEKISCKEFNDQFLIPVIKSFTVPKGIGGLLAALKGK